MLLVKMDYLDQWTEARRANAGFYQEHLRDMVQVPEDKPHEYAVYHTFIIQAEHRDELQGYLLESGVETKVHYPIPIHLQEAARDLGYHCGRFPIAERQAKHILSLPVYPELTEPQHQGVVDAICSFYRQAVSSAH